MPDFVDPLHQSFQLFCDHGQSFCPPSAASPTCILNRSIHHCILITSGRSADLHPQPLPPLAAVVSSNNPGFPTIKHHLTSPFLPPHSHSATPARPLTQALVFRVRRHVYGLANSFRLTGRIGEVQSPIIRCPDITVSMCFKHIMSTSPLIKTLHEYTRHTASFDLPTFRTTPHHALCCRPSSCHPSRFCGLNPSSLSTTALLGCRSYCKS
jgi:hypothetical protein